MCRSLMVLDAEADDLSVRWVLPQAGNGNGDESSRIEIVSLAGDQRRRLKDTIPSVDRPHKFDVVGWRHFLKDRGIAQVHCYQPSWRALPMLAAAKLCKRDISIYLAGAVTSRVGSVFRRKAQAGSVRFICAAKCVADQLLAEGVDPGRVVVRVPSVESRSAGAALRRRMRGGIGGSDNFCVLALARPQNSSALRLAVWSAALVKYASGNVQLVVAGACPAETRRRLLGWQSRYQVDEMLYFDDGDNEWDELLGACDVLLAVGAASDEPIRLLHGCAAQVPIIAAVGAGAELLADCGEAQMIDQVCPQRVAAAIKAEMEAARSLRHGRGGVSRQH